MRYTEFNPLISEAPMNPGEYHKAIDTGQTAGVLVGFEFECVVPKETIAGNKPAVPEPEPESPTGPTKESVATTIADKSIITSSGLSQFTPKEFDALFTFKPGKSKFPNMEATAAAYYEHILDKVKVIFHSIPEKIRIKAIPMAKARVGVSYKISTNKQLNFTYYFGNVLSDKFYARNSGGSRDIQEKGWQISRNVANIEYDDLLTFAFGEFENGNTQYVEENLNMFLDYDPELVYRKLELADYDEDDEDEYDEDDDYSGAVKILKPALEQSQGRKVAVFTRYHEKSKNMTDWYIEPDGSLEGDNDGDGTAEVVSPPLPAKEAVTALKNFFSMASNLKIYTNESTGLHINVSIPAEIDLLKLAVFTGDQYVLKHFNRLDNTYANSVTRDIPARAGKRALSVKLGPAGDKNVFGNQKISTTVNTALLQKIAKDVSSAHVASISSNGKWISFRHTGGNYLKDYNEIFNVVGRFVRAVIIASDPTMYVQEYKAAVAKMAAPKDSVSGALATTLNYLSTKGMPVLEISIADISTKADTINIPKLFKKICSSSYSLPGTIPPDQLEFVQNGAEAKQKMVAAANPSSQFKNLAAAMPETRFASALYYPKDNAQMKKFADLDNPGVSSIYFNGHSAAGYYMLRLINLPPTDPRTKKMMIGLRKAHYLTKKPAAPARPRRR